MAIASRALFLTLFFTVPISWGLKPGDSVPNFVMSSDNAWPQRLSEQVGQPVMLIWLDGCTECNEWLIDWQDMAESLQEEGLVSWIVYQPKPEQPKIFSRLPLLRYEASNPEAWWFGQAPAIMLISPDGVLDYLFMRDMSRRKDEINSTMRQWLEDKPWLAVDNKVSGT